MNTKTIFTEDYVLLLDSSLNDGRYYWNDLDKALRTGKHWGYSYHYGVLAYKKLNQQASDLDLPLLPDWDGEVDELTNDFHKGWDLMIDEYSKGHYDGFKRAIRLHKDKLFTLEDIEKAIELAKEYKKVEERVYEDTYSKEEIIQQLQQSKLPKEFIPELEHYYEKYPNQWFKTSKSNYDMVKRDFGEGQVKISLKIIDTPQGKQAVGKWAF